MPLPTPRKGEEKNKFIARCIESEEKQSDRPLKQIQAICYNRWKNKTK